MPVRSAQAKWEGTLQEGAGSVYLGSGVLETPYTYKSRFEDGAGTNPEELLGAAHAACFTMALNARLFRAGFAPEFVRTTAEVSLEKTESGFSVSNIHLVCLAKVADITAEVFQENAAAAKDTCIISRALSAVPMTLDARLE